MNKQAGLLRGVCLLGFVVSLVLLGTLIFLSIQGGIPLFSPVRFGKTSFALALEEYDKKILENPDLSFRQHNALLDSLEKKALDIENTLSALKRRRIPARILDNRDHEQHRSSYIAAADRARKLYPYSPQISALRAESLIMGGFSAEDTAEEIRDLAAAMSQGGLTDLSLAFSVYSGAMGDPAPARFLPRELFTLLCSLTQGEEREKYLVNSCIRTLLDNTQEGITMVNGLFEETLLRNETAIFGAEFFYDHGNFFRSAELFSVFTDSRNLARQADALWLAGFTGSARGLWQAAAAENRNPLLDDPSIRSRSFYNLASTAPTAQEASRSLEQLFAANAEYEPGQIFGIIRYSRLVPIDRALAILNQTDHEHEGLFDLELLRRRSADWEIDKTVAETWMLLNRHSNDGRLFEWAVWYFDFQRRYDETALALRNANINRVEGPWSALHRAFALVRDHEFGEAERTLRSIVRSPQETKNAPGRRTQPLWQARANLALLLEKQHNYQEALQYYEIAAGQLGGLQAEPLARPPDDPLFNPGESLTKRNSPAESPGIPAAGTTPERRDAAKIQVHIAGVLRSLGKRPESIRALDYALDLDPENLEARLEKRRLDADRGLL
jgi:tetratricopeptide (TPR) repeat protein